MRLANKLQRRGGYDFGDHADNGGSDGPWNVVVGIVYHGPCGNWPVLSLHQGLREDIGQEAIPMMISVTLTVVVFIFVYLVVALLRPEWF
jgi:K+-transporting ATPase KdpF subunit